MEQKFIKKNRPIVLICLYFIVIIQLQLFFFFQLLDFILQLRDNIF